MKRQIRIKGLSRKMRNKIREHGDVWTHCSTDTVDSNRISIETIRPVHHGLYPYGVWVTVGKDVEIIDTTGIDGSV